MFDWFKNIGHREYLTDDRTDMEKISTNMSKVVPFPELKAVQPAPKEESTGKTCYSIGLTDDSRVSLHVGYSSVIMNAAGVDQLIDQLTLFKSQMESNES